MKGAWPMTVSPRPSWEPDMQVSRIRLVWQLSPNQRTFPFELEQTELLQVLVECLAGGNSVAALTLLAQVLSEPYLDVEVDLVEGIFPVAVAEVVAPAAELPVDGSNELGHGHCAHVRAGQLTQRIFLPLHCFGRGSHAQHLGARIPTAVDVAEGVAQKIQTLFLHINYARFLPVQFQS